MAIISGMIPTVLVENCQFSRQRAVDGPSRFSALGVDLWPCSLVCCRQPSCTESSRKDGEQSVEDGKAWYRVLHFAILQRDGPSADVSFILLP